MGLGRRTQSCNCCLGHRRDRLRLVLAVVMVVAGGDGGGSQGQEGRSVLHGCGWGGLGLRVINERYSLKRWLEEARAAT